MSKPKRRSPSEIYQDQLESEEKLKNRLKKQRSKRLQRKRDIEKRKLCILGEMLLYAIEQGHISQSTLDRWLDHRLEDKSDRQIFGLALRKDMDNSEAEAAPEPMPNKRSISVNVSEAQASPNSSEANGAAKKRLLATNANADESSEFNLPGRHRY